MASRAFQHVAPAADEHIASKLLHEASVEIGGADFMHFDRARGLLRPGQRIFVSHLPGQTWDETFAVSARIAAAGFDPVPHVPVRLLHGERQLRDVLAFAADAGVREPLLISGDYRQPVGAYSSVLQVLRTGALQSHGFKRVSLAGHPEGHPHVPWDVICQAQIDKWHVASFGGLQVTMVTQFFFSAEPFVNWARLMRAAGVDARLLAGLAGPTGLGRLVKLATHCGVGASLRTLTARPASMLKCLIEQDPGALLSTLASAKQRQGTLFDGVHLFSLGGFLRTLSWMRQWWPGPSG
jgi:methylenetetrahydrofolate reductase (NADPH)